MRERYWQRLALRAGALMLLVLLGCTPVGLQAPVNPTEQARQARDATATAAAADADREAMRLLAQMSLDEKVGQLMVVGFNDASASPAITEMVRDRHAGGVILFARNLRDPPQIRALTDALQAHAREGGTHIPIFTMLDQEGGTVLRTATGVTAWPSQMLLGATDDEARVARSAQLNAIELRALGINTNLAPVLDVNSNPANPVIGTRSFGAAPNLVARMGAAAIRAYTDAGVVAVGKHFPGHGDTTVDSHVALPVIDKAPDDLDQLEFVPFRAAIQAGVDCIMTAHIDLPRITHGAPATLSSDVLETLLRKHLGFDGLIITDDLEMGAIAERYGSAEAALAAFRAGADLLLFNSDLAEQRHGYDLLRAAVEREPALQTRLNESVRRILRVKLLRGLFNPLPAPPLDEVGSPAHSVAAQEAAGAGLTLLRNDANILPLNRDALGKLLVLDPRPEDVAHIEMPLDPAITLGDALAHYRAVDEHTFTIDPSPQEQAALVAAAQDATTIVIGTANAQQYAGQRALVEALLATGKPVVIVSMHLPYDLAAFPRAPTLLAAYDDRPATLTAIADALFGVRAPEGHLPVPLGTTLPIGYGLRGYRQIDTIVMDKQ